MPPSDLGPLSISGTRLDFAMSTARVHTFQAKGLLGFLLGIAIVVGITVVIALIFTFALGVGDVSPSRSTCEGYRSALGAIARSARARSGSLRRWTETARR